MDNFSLDSAVETISENIAVENDDAIEEGMRSLSALFLTGLMTKSSTVIASAAAYDRASVFMKSMKTDSSVR